MARIEIEKLGRIENTVLAEPAWPMDAAVGTTLHRPVALAGSARAFNTTGSIVGGEEK